MREAERVNHPNHYGGDTVYEVIKVLQAWGFYANAPRFNAIKYLARAGKKEGSDTVEDLKKARWYVDEEIRWFEQSKKDLLEKFPGLAIRPVGAEKPPPSPAPEAPTRPLSEMEHACFFCGGPTNRAHPAAPPCGHDVAYGREVEGGRTECIWCKTWPAGTAKKEEAPRGSTG